MTEADAIVSINEMLQAVYDPEEYNYAFQGQQFDPSNIGKKTFFVPVITFSGTGIQTLGGKGDRLFMRKGIISVSVFSPITLLNPYTAMIYAMGIRDVFEGNTFGSSGSFTECSVTPSQSTDVANVAITKCNFTFKDVK